MKTEIAEKYSIHVFPQCMFHLVTSFCKFDMIQLLLVLVAPIKALCSERFSDWKTKFEPYGLRVMELTGDTDTDEFYELQNVNIILTTPVCIVSPHISEVPIILRYLI